MFLQAPDPNKEDVRIHLRELRKQVLPGVHIVFSHVIPLEQDMTEHHLWRLATQVLLLPPRQNHSTLAVFPSQSLIAWVHARSLLLMLLFRKLQYRALFSWNCPSGSEYIQLSAV